MEKRKSHYNLEEVKSFIRQGNCQITKVASRNAEKDFSLLPDEIIEIINTLENIDLYKSMTVNENNKLWQDVYHKIIINKGTAYIKLQILDNESVIIQFKRK